MSANNTVIAKTIPRDETPVAKLIRERGLKKSWVAARLGMRTNRVSDLCSGKGRWLLDEAQRAADLFGVDVRELQP